MTPSSPAAEPICPRCGAPLASTAAGLCARCVMADVMQPTGERDQSEWIDPPAVEELAPDFPALELLECLGRGGMGIVYKARQKSLNRLVALKLLAPEKADDPAFAERFAKEARLLATLTHPNIVAVHDFGKAGHYYYLLMEFVDGPNLRTLMTGHKLSPSEALSIVPPICDALQCAHDRGIVHRDIKPENILLDKSGLVKIADFGIAKLLAAPPENELVSNSAAEPGNAPLSMPLGTPAYAAPEQKAGANATDPRADIYSLGVVLYEMLTGELPTGKLTLPSRKVQIDVRLDEIVLKALDQMPELRFQTVAELKTRIENIATAPLPKPPVPPVQILPWKERWSWDTANLATAAVIVCLLLLLVIPWLPAAVNWRITAYILIALGGSFALYAWVGWRMRSIKADLATAGAETCEALIFRRPFQAPGIAALHHGRLDLFPILGPQMLIELQDIRSLNEVTWFNGTLLIGKRGFVMELKNGRRVGVAVPESIARRWRFILSQGSLPEEPATAPAVITGRTHGKLRRQFMLIVLAVLVLSSVIALTKVLSRTQINDVRMNGFGTEIHSSALRANSVAPSPQQQPYFPKKLTPAILAEPPRLRFLAWEDESIDSLHLKAWHPDGTPVTEEAEQKLTQRLPMSRMKDESVPEARFLLLWFSHPGADTDSFSSITFIDENGKAISGTSSAATGGQPASERLDSLGWITDAASPGRVGQMPHSLRIHLTYTVGPWKRSTRIEADYHGVMTFSDNVMLGGIGGTTSGENFLSLSYSVPNSFQYDAYAVLKDGRRLAHNSANASTSGALGGHSFSFPCPLEQVQTFEVRQRAFQEADYDHVVLRSKGDGP